MSETFTRSFPRVIRIEPSASCNLRCSHCPTGTVEMARGIMKPDLFEEVVRNLEPHISEIKVVVLYHGGEPLLNKHFSQMVTRLKGIGIGYVKTVSNGMLLKESVDDILIDSGLDAIEFSLDGQSPEENNFVRRRSDYSTVLSNIQRFLKRKKQRKAKTPHVYISSAQFLKKEDADQRHESAPLPRYLISDLKGYVDEIDFKTTYAVQWPHMNVEEEFYELFQDPRDQEIKNECDHVDHTVTVRSNGDVVACCYDLTSQYVLGNVQKKSLVEIWNGPAYRALRKGIHEKKFVPMCNNCAVVKPPKFLIHKNQFLSESQEKPKSNPSAEVSLV